MASAICFVFGVLTIGLGIKGFTAEGIPFTPRTRIKGKAAVVAGVFCFIAALCMFAFAYIHAFVGFMNLPDYWELF